MRTFRYTYTPAPGWGPKNSMAAWDTIKVVIPISKDEIYEDARVALHKFGDARLTAENEYHIHVVQADDMDEDVRLFERSFSRAFKDAVTACMAYYHTAVANKTGYIRILPNIVNFGANPTTYHDENKKDMEVQSDDDWTLQLTDDMRQASGDQNDTDYLYAIGLLMPSTWRTDVYESLCDNVYDYILFSIIADFLKLTEPREYGFYKEEADKYRIWIKDALEMRQPFTRYIEIKPF